MSNLSEIIDLYRDDISVDDNLLGRFIREAIEKDATAAVSERLGGRVEPLADFGLYHESADPDRPCRCGATDRWHSPGHPDCLPIASLGAREPVTDLMTPEEAARYLLVQHEQVVKTIETIGEAITLMNQLDDKRAKETEELAAAVELLAQRMDLRAEECRALNARIENVTQLATAGARLRPV